MREHTAPGVDWVCATCGDVTETPHAVGSPVDVVDREGAPTLLVLDAHGVPQRVPDAEVVTVFCPEHCLGGCDHEQAKAT